MIQWFFLTFLFFFLPKIYTQPPSPQKSGLHSYSFFPQQHICPPICSVRFYIFCHFRSRLPCFSLNFFDLSNICLPSTPDPHALLMKGVNLIYSFFFLLGYSFSFFPPPPYDHTYLYFQTKTDNFLNIFSVFRRLFLYFSPVLSLQ